ncbi:MAG: DNA repair protein RadC [Alicyclobacillus sp.]|nr:DNA repair protein RadC [Alicyclobacillus sp.]
MAWMSVMRVALVRDGELPISTCVIRSASDAYRILSTFLEDADREHFVVLLLDTKHNIIGFNTVSIGTLDASLVHPREVLKPAILANASGILVAHNHPSGDPNPSPEDIAVSKRLDEACRIVGISLVDHLIIGDNRYVSLRAEHYLY